VFWRLLLATLVPDGVLAASAGTTVPDGVLSASSGRLVPDGVLAVAFENIDSRRCSHRCCWKYCSRQCFGSLFCKRWFQTVFGQLLLATLVPNGVLAASAGHTVPGGVLTASSRNTCSRWCFRIFFWKHWFPTVFWQLLLEQFLLEASVPDGVLAASSRNAGSRRCFWSFVWKHWFPWCFGSFFKKRWRPTVFWQLLLATLVPDGVSAASAGHTVPAGV
jgi:hypothetical protein